MGAYSYRSSFITVTAAATTRHKKIMKICYRLKFTTTNNSHTHTDEQTAICASSIRHLDDEYFAEHAVYLTVNATNSSEHLHRLIINLSEVYYSLLLCFIHVIFSACCVFFVLFSFAFHRRPFLVRKRGTRFHFNISSMLSMDNFWISFDLMEEYLALTHWILIHQLVE